MTIQEAYDTIKAIPLNEGWKRYITLLRLSSEGKIDGNTLEKIGYLWTLEIGEDYYKEKPLPEKPYSVAKYEELKNIQTQIAKERAKEYYNMPEVKGYYETVKKIQRENSANKEWYMKAKAWYETYKKEVENGNKNI